mgnify:CR=1 FL=1
MLGSKKDVFNFPLFYYFALAHDNNAIANLAGYAKVVCDEQDANGQSLLNIIEQVQDLRLYRYVQCGDGFVRDQDFGLAG